MRLPRIRKPDPDLDPAVIKRYLPWVVATALFMEQLDSTIVNTAVPAMAMSLGVTPLSLKAVVTSYIVSLAVGIPISGWIADRFGARRVFCAAILIFTAGSISCGFAYTFWGFVVSRAIQGMRGAMMEPVGRLVILRSVPKAELGEQECVDVRFLLDDVGERRADSMPRIAAAAQEDGRR